MIRDVKKLFDKHFDLLVIGGGIYGAWTAYDAALRGLKVALIDKNDWASGTSSASSKLIHGGLRYLEQFQISLVKKSIQERQRLMKLGPHRIKNLRFLIPLYKENRVGPLKLRIGLWAYDFLAGKKNFNDSHQFICRQKTLTKYPFLADKGLKGVLTYGDCQTDDFRFTLEIISGAYNSGVVAVSYVEATDLITVEDRITGAKAVDHISNTRFDIQASTVVNTAGPWLDSLSNPHESSNLVRLTKGVHLILPPYGNDDAILGMSKRDGRIFFILPWYGHTLLGTTDTDFIGSPDHVDIGEEDIDYLLYEANRIIRDHNWTQSSILGGFAGLRALRKEVGKAPSAVSREWSLEEPKKRLLISIGGKFTSARSDAAVIVDRVMELLRKNNKGGSPTETRLFPWSPPGVFSDWRKRTIKESILLGLNHETAKCCVSRYGRVFEDILEVIRSDSSLTAPIIPDLPFCKAEIIQSVKHEMAQSLEDILRRRVPVILFSQVNRDVLEETTSMIGPILGWTPEKKTQQVEDTFNNWNRLCVSR